jgi:hypothetical protein
LSPEIKCERQDAICESLSDPVRWLKYLAPLILLSYDDVGDFTGEHSWFFSPKVDDWNSPVVVRLTAPFAL